MWEKGYTLMVASNLLIKQMLLYPITDTLNYALANLVIKVYCVFFSPSL